MGFEKIWWGEEIRMEKEAVKELTGTSEACNPVNMVNRGENKGRSGISIE